MPSNANTKKVSAKKEKKPEPEPEYESEQEVEVKESEYESEKEVEVKESDDDESEKESNDDETELVAPTTPPKKVRAKKPDAPKKEKKVKEDAPSPKKTRKVHAVKASEHEEGFTKTEDGITYIVRNKKWMVVKEPREKVAKRPPTACNLFVKQKVQELRSDGVARANTDYFKLAMSAWTALSAEEKAEYKESLNKK